MANVQVVYLLSNQPVIGHVQPREDGVLVMHKPMLFEIGFAPPSNVMLNLVPLGVFSGPPEIRSVLNQILDPIEELVLEPGKFLHGPVNVPARLAQQYIQLTTGIEIVDNVSRLHVVG